MRLPFVAIPALCAMLGACSEFPELDQVIDNTSRDAPFPKLVPIHTITSSVPDSQIRPDATLDIEMRVSRLRARAARLKGTVVDGATRERMVAGVN